GWAHERHIETGDVLGAAAAQLPAESVSRCASLLVVCGQQYRIRCVVSPERPQTLPVGTRPRRGAQRRGECRRALQTEEEAGGIRSEEENQRAISASVAHSARSLAHSTRDVPVPADMYPMLGDLTDATASLAQVCRQLATWHQRAVDGIDYDGEDADGD